jgi:hypothetical protein
LHVSGAHEGLPGAPLASGTHAPLELHDSQFLSHTSSQHLPSAQNPLAHSFAPPHSAPCACVATQAVPSQ